MNGTHHLFSRRLGVEDPLPTPPEPPRREDQLLQLLNRALIHRIDGNEGQMASALLTAVEVAYGMGQLPSNLVALIDDINSVRRLMGSAFPAQVRDGE